MADANSTASGHGMARDLSESQLIFRIADGPEDQFQVIRYRGTEGLCQLYRFEITLASTEAGLGVEGMEGKPAVLVAAAGSAARSYYGVVAKFEVTGETHDLTYFRVELVPALWLLTHRYNSQIFSEQTTEQIITEVVTAAGISADRLRFDLKEPHTPREYCVQYRETDFNFVSRLMEEEGIWWYFEQPKPEAASGDDGGNGSSAGGGGAQSDTLVIVDSEQLYADIDPPPEGADVDWGLNELPYHPQTGLNVESEHVSRFRLGRAVRPGKVLLSDFNFEKPGLKLWCEGDAGRDSSLEFFDYPGEFTLQARGTELAKLRSQEFETSRTVGIGMSNSHRLLPGRTFGLIEHPNTTINDSYLVTRITHYGSQAVARAAADISGGNGVLGSSMHQAVLAARGHEDQTVRDLAEAMLQIARRLMSGDPTAHRSLTEWLYHAGQVSRDLSAIGAALGANPMEALSIPNLMDDGHAGQLNEHEGPLYECRFECIPASVVYRPPRVTPWPMMRGCQTAKVVGEGGDDSEEIVTDKYGRVKVLFNWDRRGHENKGQSCWVRVAQGSAGGGYGMFFLPRIGHEVIVDFLEGDPDKPIITGCVYNDNHMPPYELPKEKTKSVIKTNSTPGAEGFNEIRFEDKKEAEQIFTHAQKDHDLRVENDAKELVGNDKHVIIENDRFDHTKNDHHEIVEANHTGKVAGNVNKLIEGNHLYQADGDRASMIGGARKEDIASDDDTKVGGNRSQEVAQTLSTKAMKIQIKSDTDFGVDATNFGVKATAGAVIECPGGICFKAGGSFIHLTAGAVFISGPTVMINSGGAAVPANPVQVTAPVAGDQPEEATEAKEADKADPGKDKQEWPAGPPSPQAEALANAAATGAPFCQLCEEMKQEEEEEQEAALLEIPLEVESAEASAPRTIDVTFNQDVDPACLQDPDKKYLRFFSVDDAGYGTLARNPHEVVLAGNKATLTWTEGDMLNGHPVRVRASGDLQTLEGEELDPRRSIVTCGGNGVDRIQFEGIKVTTSRSVALLFDKEIATEDIEFEDGRKISVQSPAASSRYHVEVLSPTPWKGRPEQATVLGNKITLHFTGRPFADGQRIVVYPDGKVWDKDGQYFLMYNLTNTDDDCPYVATNVSIGPSGGSATNSSSDSGSSGPLTAEDLERQRQERRERSERGGDEH